jgi:hypothetical protein
VRFLRWRARDEALRAWGESLIERHGADVARVIGHDGPLPHGLRVEVAAGGSGAAWTSGLTITLNARWFAEHPDDAGGVLHELAHAIMRAPRYDQTTIWLIEGIADHVRDALGFDERWTFAHFEPGKATAGYQTTAHFLAWLETERAGAVAELSRRLSDGTYDRAAFEAIAGRRLEDLVAAYERASA